MVITQEILDELFKLYEQLNYYRELHSEQLKTVQDQFGQRHVKLTREGQEVVAKEKDLWDEVRLLGINTEAGELLKGKYPDVFESYEKYEQYVEEARMFVLKNMGFNFTQMSLGDYIKLTLGLIDYAGTKSKPAGDDSATPAAKGSRSGKAE